ncbi:hypothetical protein LOD99_4185 [Oopsacas minuta]|uniref:Uncharacterized protein n=1 Tax=Oopsacas minuta TaxID=111878 RepID=A0AAV7JV19_9METZ|nr:hypothetical protein LOD99_4185 [Oopsacas minuta]
MISIWDMIVGSGYPIGKLYIGIGMGVFAISLLVSLLTLPFIIFLIDKCYSRVQKVTLGGGGRFDKDKQYEYDHFRIVICFLVGVIIFMLLTIVMSVHGIYFLYKMFIDERYLQKINNYEGQGESKALYIYVIPTSHYVLYFLEAAYEAAEGNLILWGFLFLVNFISNLTDKEFYFKIFTLILSLRVIFVFACHFNIWELIINISDFEDDSTIQTLALEAYPFHTFAKLLRVVEILLSLIIFIPFALYMRRLMINKSNEDNEEDQPLLLDPMKARFTTEMKFGRKYLRGYIVFLLIYLVLNLIECHLVSLIVSSAKESSKTVEFLFAMSVVADILAFLPSFLFLLFITYFAYSTTKKGAVKSDNQEFGPRRHKRKRFLFIGFIILFSSVFCASFIGYLRFTDGDDFQVDFHPGDYILVPPPNDTQTTNLSTFINSCDSVKISGSPSYQLTIFDFLEYYFNDFYYKDINKTRLLFYKDYEKNQKYFNQRLNMITPMPLWFPGNTCFYNITLVESINYTVIPFPYPCYDAFNPSNEGSANAGLRVMCLGFEDAMKKNQEILFCTKNESMSNNNNCCLHKDSIIGANNIKPQIFTARRPFYMGYNLTTNYSNLKSGKLIQFSHQFPYSDKETFYLTCQYTPWLAVGILVSICLLMGLYLTLSYIIVSKLFSLCYFSRSVTT